MNRVLTFGMLLFSILFLPFWVFAILGLAALLYYPKYVEIIPLCLLYDLLFGVGITIWSLDMFLFTVSIPLYFLVQFAKKQMLIFE